MVDVKDIMLGNFVKKMDEILVVGKVHRDSVADKWGEICFDDEIEPIPVTIEMLKRIGFDAHKGICPKTFYRYWDKEYHYKLDVDPDFCNSDRKFSIHIDNGDCNTIGCGEFTYVHELQNLVRIITGFSLPITKEML